MASYTQAAGTKTDTYFQDVAISPVTVKDGSLRRRLDQKRYPKLGKTAPVSPTIASVAPSTGAHNTSVDLTIVGTHFEPDSVVTVSGAGVTAGTVTNISHLGKTLKVTVTIANGAATGARNVTVTNPDTGAATATGALTIT